MEITPLRLRGTYLISPSPKRDERGYFMRCWDNEIAAREGLVTSWVQENESFNDRKLTLRGLHFQAPPHAETKLVRVTSGAIFDVFVDLRKSSETYGQWDSVELSPDNHRMAYIPKGFAHGYCTLTEDACVIYKVDECYAPSSEGGLRWNDETLGIAWPRGAPVLSPRDQSLPELRDLKSPFV